MRNSRKYAGLSFGILGTIAFWVGGCSGDVSLGGGANSIGGHAGTSSPAGGDSSTGGTAAGGAASSGGSTWVGAGHTGTGGVTGGTAASGGNACAISECFRAVECVQYCGGPVVSSGCCACQNGMIDRATACNGTGGNTSTGGAASGGAASSGASAATGGSSPSGGGASAGGAPSTGGAGGAQACSTACTTDTDCACGVNSSTRACAIGRVECIDTSQQCPDFCTGIAGNRRIACVNQQCTEVIASGGSSSTGGTPSAGGSTSSGGNHAGAGGTAGAGGAASGGVAASGGSVFGGGTTSTSVYQPCAGKSCGDTCTLCAPGDPNCSEAAVLKSCDLSGQCLVGTVNCSTADTYVGCLDIADPDDFIILTKATYQGMCVTLWLSYGVSTNSLGLGVPTGWTPYYAASWPASTASCAVATRAPPVTASHATSGAGTVTFNGSPWLAGFTVNVSATLTFPQGDAGTNDSETLQATALPAGGACVLPPP